MPQRDGQSTRRARFVETLTQTGTGDTNGTVTIDTQGLRSLQIAIANTSAMNAADRVTFKPLESDLSASGFTDIDSDSIVPADTRVDETQAAEGTNDTVYQTFGVTGTKRYVRVGLNATVLTAASEVFDFIAIEELAEKPAEGVATDAQP
jgi:hypothetical protein